MPSVVRRGFQRSATHGGDRESHYSYNECLVLQVLDSSVYFALILDLNHPKKYQQRCGSLCVIYPMFR